MWSWLAEAARFLVGGGENKPSSIAAGFRKLAIATVVFGIAYVLFFGCYFAGD